jgi:DNA-binding beta-propeller fold protein YncE
MHPTKRGVAAVTVVLTLAAADIVTPAATKAYAAQAVPEIMAVGIDRKFSYEDGKRITLEPGHDEIIFYELTDPAKPVRIGSLPLENSIVGPPTNIAITPDQRLALIANSLHSEALPGGGWTTTPSDELYVVDLAARPPLLISTIKVGRQPSGVSINKAGTLALVANRDSKSITVLAINGREVTVKDTVDMIDTVGAVAISPDGRRAVATKTLAHKAALLTIDDTGKVRFDRDLWTGLFPWNVAITPDGRSALVNNAGNAGLPDGNLDTVSVIDLGAAEPHVIGQVAVGDSPEGIVIRPQGDFAAVTLLNGGYDSHDAAWYWREAGRVALLKIDSKNVTMSNTAEVGSFPEGIAFSRDGNFIYAGNFHSNSISILSIGPGGSLKNMGTRIELPGPPASLRIGSR